jgi:hypothetical protein
MEGTKQPTERYVSTIETAIWGSILGVLGVVLFAALINLWPVVDQPAADAATPRDVTFLFGLVTLSLTKSSGLIMLAIVAGALGGYIHATTSFVVFVGNRELLASWLWWYALRLFVGASLAVLVYVAIRGGLFGSEAATEQVNPYGVAAFSGLVGLFSKQAVDKLEELFDTFFHVERARRARRRDKLGHTHGEGGPDGGHGGEQHQGAGPGHDPDRGQQQHRPATGPPQHRE